MAVYIAGAIKIDMKIRHLANITKQTKGDE